MPLRLGAANRTRPPTIPLARRQQSRRLGRSAQALWHPASTVSGWPLLTEADLRNGGKTGSHLDLSNTGGGTHSRPTSIAVNPSPTSSRPDLPNTDGGVFSEQTPTAVDPGPAGSRPDLSNMGDGVLSRQTSNEDASGANTSHPYFPPPDLTVTFRAPCDARSGTVCYEPRLNLDEKTNESRGLAHGQGGRAQPPISWSSGVFPRGM